MSAGQAASLDGLRTVDARKLDGWIMEVLQPSTAFCQQVKQTVRQICDFLKEDCFDGNTRVLKTVKVSAARLRGQPSLCPAALVPALPQFPLAGPGMVTGCQGSVVLSEQGISLQGGSAGKGTALRNNSDADVVLFLSRFSSYQDQKQERKNVLDSIKERLHACHQSLSFTVDITEPRYKGPGNKARSLSLTLSSKKTLESIEVDILPAYDALGKGCGLAWGQAAASALARFPPSLLPRRPGDWGQPTNGQGV